MSRSATTAVDLFPVHSRVYTSPGLTALTALAGNADQEATASTATLLCAQKLGAHVVVVLLFYSLNGTYQPHNQASDMRFHSVYKFYSRVFSSRLALCSLRPVVHVLRIFAPRDVNASRELHSGAVECG